MSSYSFALPLDFADYEWEVTAKGCFSEARVIVAGKQYRLNFYDAVRLGERSKASLRTAVCSLSPIWWSFGP